MRTRTFSAFLALLAVVLAGQTVATPAAHAGPPPTWQQYRNYNSGLCLTPSDYPNYSPVRQETCGDYGLWHFEYVTTNANGTPLYLIKSALRGCLEYTGDIGTSSDARIYACVDSGSRSRQLWWFAGPNGKVTIRTVNRDVNGRNLCLEIEDSRTTQGASAQLWTCSGQAGSFWKFQYLTT